MYRYGEKMGKLPKIEIINGYRVSQAKNYHVSISKDNRPLFHAQCNKERDLREMLDLYMMMQNIKDLE